MLVCLVFITWLLVLLDSDGKPAYLKTYFTFLPSVFQELACQITWVFWTQGRRPACECIIILLSNLAFAGVLFVNCANEIFYFEHWYVKQPIESQLSHMWYAFNTLTYVQGLGKWPSTIGRFFRGKVRRMLCNRRVFITCRRQ